MMIDVDRLEKLVTDDRGFELSDTISSCTPKSAQSEDRTGPIDSQPLPGLILARVFDSNSLNRQSAARFPVHGDKNRVELAWAGRRFESLRKSR